MPFVRRRQGSVLCNGVRVYSVTEWRLQLNCRRHFLCSPSGLIIFFLKFLPGTAEFMVHKGFLQSCYLFQPKNLIQLHSQLGTYFSSDQPERVRSMMMALIGRIPWVPLARLCRMVAAILWSRGLFKVVTGR